MVSMIGIGMPNEFIPLLFTPYSQAKLSTVRETGGTGLGLSIAKRIIELMNGTIRVESKVGEGSAFTLTIPFKSSAVSASFNG
jgi:signal transduction histidine kinase